MTIRSKARKLVREQILDPIIPKLSRGITFEEAWPKIELIEGWLVSPHQERWLFDTVRNLPWGANILEIGSFKGRSTVSMALGCIGTARRVFAIDTFCGNQGDFVNGRNEVEWEGESFYDQFSANVEKAGVSNYVIPMIGESREIARHWKAPIHLMFVDGSHLYEDILTDWNCYFPYVVSQGIVAFHDVTPDWAGPYRAWNDDIKVHLVNTEAIMSLAFGIKP